MTKTIGLIVDGEGDFQAMRARYSNQFKVLKTDGPRGHTATVEGICRRATKQVRMLAQLGCSRVILVLDFERRAEPYESFVQALHHSLQTCFSYVEITAAVPNQMIENWYLADIAYLSKRKAFLRKNLAQKRYEGRPGKDMLKTCMATGHTYRETEHGPALFRAMRLNDARRRSPSLDHFLSLVGCASDQARCAKTPDANANGVAPKRSRAVRTAVVSRAPSESGLWAKR